jgi:hypoxanthine phosphoribosyltransferase
VGRSEFIRNSDLWLRTQSEKIINKVVWNICNVLKKTKTKMSKFCKKNAKKPNKIKTKEWKNFHKRRDEYNHQTRDRALCSLKRFCSLI